MGTKVYGPQDNITDTAVFKPYVDYTTKTNNATTYTLTLAAGIKLIDILGFQPTSISITLTATGKSNATGSKSFDPAYTDNKDYTIISSRDVSWTKTHTAQTITITSYHSSSKKASKTFTIPAKTKYTITYNANGGSGSVSSSAKWHGEAITLPAASNFTRSGYKPIKFNTNASGTGTSYNFGASYNVNANQTLYVIWQKDYTINYNPNGGTNAPNAQAKPYNESIILSTLKPVREGYTFLGWSTSSTSTTITYNGGETYSTNSDLNLYAIWKLEYDSRTVYELNVSGEYNVSQKDIPRATQKVTGDSIEAQYEFLGWALTKPTTIIYPSNITSAEDITDIKVYTDINSSMSNTFYAVYRDITPSDLTEIYHDTVIAHSNDDMAAEFQNYINTISKGDIYVDNNDESHTLFGYIQCNTDVVLNDLQGSCSNIQNIKTIDDKYEEFPYEYDYDEDYYFYDYTFEHEPLSDSTIKVIVGEYADLTVYPPEEYQFTAGTDDWYMYRITGIGWVIIKYTTSTGSHFRFDSDTNTFGPLEITYEYLDSSLELDDIQILGDKIFFRITSNEITNTSRHVIEITGTDSQYKSVVFNIKNKIKTPLIDIKPHSNIIWPEASEFDNTGRGIINIPSVNIKQGKLIVENPTLIDISNPNGNKYNETFITCQRTTNPNADISFGIGAGGINRGIWLDNKNGDPTADNDSGGWLIYADGNGIIHTLTDYNGSILSSITNSWIDSENVNHTVSGAFLTAAYATRRCNTVQLLLSVQNNNAIAAGGNWFEGTVSSAWRPKNSTVFGAAYYGTRTTAASLNTLGHLIIRNASDISISAKAASDPNNHIQSITIIYMIN